MYFTDKRLNDTEMCGRKREIPAFYHFMIVIWVDSFCMIMPYILTHSPHHICINLFTFISNDFGSLVQHFFFSLSLVVIVVVVHSFLTFQLRFISFIWGKMMLLHQSGERFTVYFIFQVCTLFVFTVCIYVYVCGTLKLFKKKKIHSCHSRAATY